MICLDTNIAIYVINRRVPAIRHRWRSNCGSERRSACPPSPCSNFVMATRAADRRAESDRLLAEFLAPGSRYFHSMRRRRARRRHRAYLESKGTPIGPMTVSSQPRPAAAAPLW